jgi:hypothetical protein
MSSGEQDTTISVPRHRVFVLEDGAFVVQWEENRVQDLLNGKYRAFVEHSDVASPISDYELNQLRNKGVVRSFDAQLIQICPTPDIISHASSRAYYLNTALPKNRRQEVEQQLDLIEMGGRLSVRTQERFVIIRGLNGVPFPGFDDAEKARELLLSRAPDFFKNTIVAFVETIPTT